MDTVKFLKVTKSKDGKIESVIDVTPTYSGEHSRLEIDSLVELLVTYEKTKEQKCSS